MKKLETKFGTMYYEEIDGKFKLYDSNQEYIGYVETATGNLTNEEINELPKKIQEIEHISDIVNLGFCWNMMFNDSSEEDLIQQFKELGIEEEYLEENDDVDLDINRVGNIFFIVDYNEYF